MKNLLITFSTLFFLTSCSDDEYINPEANKPLAEIIADETLAARNPENPYDQTGADFYKNLTEYITKNGYPKSNAEIIDQLLFMANRKISNRTNKSIITITSEMISIILVDPENTLFDLINNSELSAGVKINLTGFVTELADKQDEDYDNVHDFIVLYEQGIVQSLALQEDEKDTILKVSSISRYSLYEEARKRDRDWETGVTNRCIKNFKADNQFTIATLAVLFNHLQ